MILILQITSSEKVFTKFLIWLHFHLLYYIKKSITFLYFHRLQKEKYFQFPFHYEWSTIHSLSQFEYSYSCFLVLMIHHKVIITYYSCRNDSLIHYLVYATRNTIFLFMKHIQWVLHLHIEILNSFIGKVINL